MFFHTFPYLRPHAGSFFFASGHYPIIKSVVLRPVTSVCKTLLLWHSSHRTRLLKWHHLSMKMSHKIAKQKGALQDSWTLKLKTSKKYIYDKDLSKDRSKHLCAHFLLFQPQTKLVRIPSTWVSLPSWVVFRQPNGLLLKPKPKAFSILPLASAFNTQTPWTPDECSLEMRQSIQKSSNMRKSASKITQITNHHNPRTLRTPLEPTWHRRSTRNKGGHRVPAASRAERKVQCSGSWSWTFERLCVWKLVALVARMGWFHVV